MSEVTTRFVDVLTDDERQALFRLGSRRTFARHATLFNQGDSSSHVAVLLEGKVKVSSYSSDGHEVVHGLQIPVALLGELSAIDGRPRSATVTALERVTVLSIPVQPFTEFLERQPRVALALLRVVAHRLRDSDLRQLELGTMDVPARLARRLVELAEGHGRESDSGIDLPLPLTQEELAQWVGASREAVVRALRGFRDRGLIATQRKRVLIRDLEGLRRRGR